MYVCRGLNPKHFYYFRVFVYLNFFCVYAVPGDFLLLSLSLSLSLSYSC